MERLEFFTEGTPVAKARPRVTRSGTFTPATTLAWENCIAISARIEMRAEPIMEGRLCLIAMFYGARANADLDNLTKAVMDALNGVVYKDDKQIDVLHAERCSDSTNKGLGTKSVGVRVVVESLS